MRVFTAADIRLLEQNAVESGFSYISLMENAGTACAETIRNIELPNKRFGLKKVSIVCGNGKNAGDGFVIARKLADEDYSVSIVLACGSPKAQESVVMLNKINENDVDVIYAHFEAPRAQSAIINCDILVDCIFGIGFRGDADEKVSKIINIMNQSNGKRVAVDVPSCLDCDALKYNDIHFKAELTIAITSPKPAHIIYPFSEICGEITVVDIGISNERFFPDTDKHTFIYNRNDIADLMPVKSRDTNKGDFGHVLSISGSCNMQGAAVIAANAAVLSGAGLVTAAFPDCAYSAIGAKLTEPLLLPLPSNLQGTLSVSAIESLREAVKNVSCVLIGPGLGVNSDTKEIVKEILYVSQVPIILDADALNIIADDIGLLKTANAPVVITPHPGEMARLCKTDIQTIEQNRIEITEQLAKKLSVNILLKGVNTLVADAQGKNIYINNNGNNGMSSGGMGDMLAGMIASFVAQGMDVYQAAVSATYIHGYCADEVVKNISKRSLTVTQMLSKLPEIFLDFE